MNLPAYSAAASWPPARATQWRLRSQTLLLTHRPVLMGIVNVTPDSFSDGGRYHSADRAVEHALRLVDAGAGILDIGGESTRPYSQPVSLEEELRRVVPVLRRICGQTQVPVSIDTSKAVVARAALDAGAEIVNDVTGLTGDPDMLPVVLASRPGVCLMHMQGTPQTMQDNPHYGDVVAEVSGYLAERKAALVAAGTAADQIALDPGIGFGKTHQHNLTLMAHCRRLHELGCPVLVGHSRKGFIGKLIGSSDADRTAGTIGGALALATQGVQIIRVHDVGAVSQALAVFLASGGVDGCPGNLEPPTAP